jgi:hypothetical protein
MAAATAVFAATETLTATATATFVATGDGVTASATFTATAPGGLEFYHRVNGAWVPANAYRHVNGEWRTLDGTAMPPQPTTEATAFGNDAFGTATYG